MAETIYVAIDYDSTLTRMPEGVTLPAAGEFLPGAREALEWIDAQPDVEWILLTLREGKLLDNAIGMLRAADHEPFGVNENPDWPEDRHGFPYRKVYAHLYIDDRALGAPLIGDDKYPHVDWDRAFSELVRRVHRRRERTR